MPDIFLSYARDDYAFAGSLVRALEAEGLTIWWDPKIDPGTQWDSVIKTHLLEAKCVIVLWSPRSTESHWVKTEAHNARDRGILLPVTIEGATPPFGFELIQSEDLTGWSGDRTATNFARVLARAKGLITGEVAPMPDATRPSRSWLPTNSTSLALLATSIFASLLIGTIFSDKGGVGTVVGVGGLCLAGISLFRGKSRKPPSHGKKPFARFRFPLEQGFFGGLFGGALAAPIISTAYYVELEAPLTIKYMQQHGWAVPSYWRVLTELLIACVSIGCTLGILSYGLAKLSDHVSRNQGVTRLGVNAVTGGLIGGALAGMITGPLATIYFGRLTWPVLEPGTMMIGALPATGLMVFSIISFDGQRLGVATARNLAIALVSTAFVTILTFVIVQVFQSEISHYLEKYLVNYRSRLDLLYIGLYYGGIVGIILGIVVGLTTALANRYRKTERAYAQQD
jgi:hypothetical protein